MKSIFFIGRIQIWCRWWLLMGVLIVMATGCAGAHLNREASKGVQSPHAKHPPKIAATGKAAKNSRVVEQKLRSEVRQWDGTPHRMGGTTRRGIDCSGFVQRLYRDIFDRKIPRSTALQVKSGQPIDKRQLRTSDLVFFKLPHKGRHVGIYLSRTEFAHASTSKGVIISSLEDPYWRTKYWTARRYINAANSK